TESYPCSQQPSDRFRRGRPFINFSQWKDARAAAAACPTGAIAYTDKLNTRTATLDLGKCTFCGLCAEADDWLRMTNTCELATCRRADLVTSATYELTCDNTHGKLLGLESHVPPNPGGATDIEVLGRELKVRINKVLGRSLHIREVDAGSCNGCEVEI